MNKVIYEYYYIIGHTGFYFHYNLTVNRETEKMYYGTFDGSGFAIKKTNMERVYVIKDKKHGLVYRVQVAAENEYEAENKARKMIYDYIMDFAEKFKNNKVKI